MNPLEQAFTALRGFVDLGGPVVAILLGLSVLTLAVILYKFWQFQRAGVGRREQRLDLLLREHPR